jgi:transcriptional regulator with XRE-family HTH domain
METVPGRLVRAARERAKLAQRTLAQRADTAQSVVARVELGQTSPTWDTLASLIGAAGFELRVTLEHSAAASHMLDDVPRILRLSPAQRLLELRNADRFFAPAERV